MKCELCGCKTAHISNMRDIVHNRVQNRAIVVCPECGFRRNLKECHSESDAIKQDLSIREIERQKKAAYQQIGRNSSGTGGRPTSTSSYASPAPRPTSGKSTPSAQNGKKQASNPIGCILALLGLLAVAFRFLSELG